MSIIYDQGANTFLPPSPVIPMFLNVVSVSQSNPMVVTVSTPNQYLINQLVYFSIPYDYGMQQLNGVTAEIIGVDATNLIFSMALDSSGFDPFVIPPTGIFYIRPATVSPAGSRNLSNFNVSIQSVPFHSQGNFGN
jgi:hypothetical protein